MKSMLKVITATSLSAVWLLGCTSGESEAEAQKGLSAQTPQVDTGPGIAPDTIAVTGPDEMTKTESKSTPDPKPKAVKSAQLGSRLPPAPRGIFSFTSLNPVGTRSRTTMIGARKAASTHAIATLQIDRLDSATLMDIAFDCASRTYVFLYMDHKARPVDAAKVGRVQSFSDRQFTAFERGEALQKLRYNEIETVPPEEVENYTRIMELACNP